MPGQLLTAKQAVEECIRLMRMRAVRETIITLNDNPDQHYFIAMWMVQQGLLRWETDENGNDRFRVIKSFAKKPSEDDKPVAIGTRELRSDPLQGVVLASNGFTLIGYQISDGEKIISYEPDIRIPDKMEHLAAFRYRSKKFFQSYDKMALAPADVPPMFCNVPWTSALEGKGILAFVPAVLLTQNAIGCGLPPHISSQIMSDFHDVDPSVFSEEFPFDPAPPFYFPEENAVASISEESE